MDHPPQKNANADIAVLYVIHVYSHPMIAATSPSSPRRVFDLTGSDASTRLHDFGAAGTARSTSLPPSHDFGVASRADSTAWIYSSGRTRAASIAMGTSCLCMGTALQ